MGVDLLFGKARVGKNLCNLAFQKSAELKISSFPILLQQVIYAIRV
jgi:hypothetical protein